MSDAFDKRRSYRRIFLTLSAAAVGSVALAQTFRWFLTNADRDQKSAGFGPLQPTADETTGLPLIELPDGFRYSSFGWAGEPMIDGFRTPRNHDGMAVIAERDGLITLCRNHEIEYGHKPFTAPATVYDPKAAAGCTLLQFDGRLGKWKSARGAISGTLRNCAGGPTPWNTWLTCEETVIGTADRARGHEKDHGWVFEVPADGPARPVPLKDMGRFFHEAVAVDPETGFVYETEDRETAGFYCFQPRVKARLAGGGTLKMLKVPGTDDLRRGSTIGQTYDVSWVQIPDPTGAKAGNARKGKFDDLAVFKQGKQQGATTFARLEGCWYGDGRVHFVSTNGGRAKCGQVWAFDPKQQTLTLLFESPAADVLRLPDNIAVSPRGGIALCEDGDIIPQRLLLLNPDGGLHPLAVNNIQLAGEQGFRGDFRKQEWAGATFSRDGNWLFANIQTPGLTLAITGPWDRGGF